MGRVGEGKMEREGMGVCVFGGGISLWERESVRESAQKEGRGICVCSLECVCVCSAAVTSGEGDDCSFSG